MPRSSVRRCGRFGTTISSSFRTPRERRSGIQLSGKTFDVAGFRVPRFATPRNDTSLPRRRHHLRQKLLALRLRTIAFYGRGEALEDAVLERGDDGVMHVALAADRGRVGQFI